MNAPPMPARTSRTLPIAPSALAAARLLLCLPFLNGGLAKLADFPAAVAEIRALAGVEPAALIAALVILVQLGGSTLVVAGGRLAWVGAAALAAFTLAATIVAHAYWEKTGLERMRDFNAFWEHVGLIGGLGVAALAGRPEAGPGR